jgi:serine/threonine-protein kinase
MVAAAGSDVAWSPARAIGVAVLIPAVFALLLVFHPKAALFQQIPWDKPPEVLADQARGLLKRLGYEDPSHDRRMGLAHDRRFLQFVEQDDLAPGRWERAGRGRPSPVYFWYRESPGRFRPLDAGSPVTQTDPPLLPGMARVKLDPRGYLRELTVQPAERGSPSSQREPDWSILLAEAGLDPAELSRVPPEGVPPLPVESRVAFEGRFPGPPAYPLRVEAGAYGGRVVDFRILGPWSAPRSRPRRADAVALLGSAVNLLLFPALIVGVLLARRNWRLGRGDRRGAWRVAAFAFGCLLVGWILRRSQLMSLSTAGGLMDAGLANALYVAVHLWVFYLALEPYVRRRWPRALLAWSRVLAGRVRDPLVGRDLLAGTLLANMAFGCLVVGRTLTEWMGHPSSRPLELKLDTLLGPSRVAAQAFTFLGLAMLMGLLLLLMLVVLRAVLRSQRAAVVAFWLFWTVLPSMASAQGDTWLMEIPVWAVFGGLLTLLVVRFGLLATTVLFFLGGLSVPITTAMGQWYGQPTLFAWALELGLAGFGLYACLAGRGLAWDRLIEE